MPDAIRTRCKFRVVGVENTEYELKRIKVNIPANTKHPVDGSESRYDRTEMESYDPPKYAQNIRLAASYDTSNPEDVSFAAATPSGTMTFYCDNLNVVGTFIPGRNYYLDLIPC
jgi:hypothetical protein